MCRIEAAYWHWLGSRMMDSSHTTPRSLSCKRNSIVTGQKDMPASLSLCDAEIGPYGIRLTFARARAMLINRDVHGRWSGDGDPDGKDLVATCKDVDGGDFGGSVNVVVSVMEIVSE